jgi:dipeptidyl-peptidase-3
VGEAAIVQVYADGFELLSPREKILCWHLAEAAIAGRDIYYDQRYAHGLTMRRVLEAVVTHPGHTPPEVLASIWHYTKLFWIHTGPFNNLTARKFVPSCTPEAFEAAVHEAVRAGATLPLDDGESVAPARAAPAAVLRSRLPSRSSRTRRRVMGRDILESSANNLYVGVTMADVETFPERYPLNSRLVKTDDGLVEEVYRVGGRYSAEIARIVGHLEAALPFASDAMAAALRALVRFYRSGEPDDRRQYDIAWVADQASPVDTMMSFIEVYMDARGVKGAWEAIVYYVHPEKTAHAQAIAGHAQWFEDRMPWAPQYRSRSDGAHRPRGGSRHQTGDAGR